MVHALAVAPPFGGVPDLLRLLAVPVFAWAAYRDLRTRRVSNATWLPLVAVGALALALDALALLDAPGLARRVFVVRLAVSLGLVAPLGYLFWRLGGFGGADAKALMTLALLFPSAPAYALGDLVFPLAPGALGVLSLSVLTNAVLVGLAYPLALAGRNLLDGHRSRWLFVGRPVPSERADREYGRLLGSPGDDRGGLDLDALRMYLRWRGTSLSTLRADATTYRDPATLPATPNTPGDGSLASFDAPSTPLPARADGGTGRTDDPWGAAAFLASIEGTAYGTTPDRLRAGLDALCEEDSVWVSPGLPFVVPLFVGLVVALVVGDLLFLALGAAGVV
ncbi:A24 family peptidase [Halomarina ordinaria]|uniref:A24 family peptidase n=1 Tax=Halomarina ordinaria TaxID=3033939 RepID=A0ABD5UA14_9EURY|nr:A24 family peptidase [Halomarina sp. PSRA2]